MGIIRFIKDEMAVIKERDPALKSKFEIFLYPSFRAMYRYRIAHWFYKHKRYLVARWISTRAAKKTGIDIHPGAQIGKGLFIDHGIGVVIGETCEIGDNVTIYQGVTLGGTGKEKGKRHPTIGNNVMISAGSKILGSFKVGDNSRIGAGSVVLKEVPPNCTVVGIPGRIVKINDKRVSPSSMLDQISLPDPVENELNALNDRIILLEDTINKLIESKK
ncbi:serine O-acetyltransferase [Natranaerovirga pectinivora]|uniref:Serine acetyltransferase n=1 Tax=Natranaerovirga pectinivora TaxID=682400 RepID=A0A4R3MM13_9FIRM|nr:serine O-acetyltransferase [Natranaerovirga pectinivora]TCT15728.1 serine O-acetyltransferase [Natranaerovirga pectinivora]